MKEKQYYFLLSVFISSFLSVFVAGGFGLDCFGSDFLSLYELFCFIFGEDLCFSGLTISGLLFLGVLFSFLNIYRFDYYFVEYHFLVFHHIFLCRFVCFQFF